MVSFTKFTWNQYGQLAYRKSGRLAPESYSVRGGTVYGSDGRKIGQIGKGTKAEQSVVRKAAAATARSKSSMSGRYSFDTVRKARAKAVQQKGSVKLQTPAPTANEIKNFGKSVKSMAKLSIGQNPKLQEKISKMDDAKLMQLYKENELIFDVYFDYGGVTLQEGKGLSGNRDTAKNAEALIDVYEKRFGTITYQSVLT